MSSGGRWPEWAGKLDGPALIRSHGCAFARFLWPPGGRFLPLGLGCHRRPRWWILARTAACVRLVATRSGRWGAAPLASDAERGALVVDPRHARAALRSPRL